jgi:hypothetical protein
MPVRLLGQEKRAQRLKYIALGDDPDWYVNLGGSLRERFESFSNSAFGFRAAGGVASENYILHRLLLSADIHLGHYARTSFNWATNWKRGDFRALSPLTGTGEILLKASLNSKLRPVTIQQSAAGLDARR